MPPPDARTTSKQRKCAVKSYCLEWTQEGWDGRQVSAVTYGGSAAEDYRARKAAQDGVTDVQGVPDRSGK
ncbi:hypothetical protein ACF064_34140 [Streptomyces sp. NPDC015492]|uniref:hypothetical protein n=1 Tax=Streptomyces sp. NPDC015492 TaxID=3364958 RepID=UPI0036FB5D2D